MIQSIDDLVRYLLRFHRGLGVTPGLQRQAVPADLPDALALVYHELGGWVEMTGGKDHNFQAPFATQDALLPLSLLQPINGFFELAHENQGIWTARCALGQGDPPVFTNSGELGVGSTTFEVVCDSLGSFLITLCLQEAVMSSPLLFYTEPESPEELFEVPLVDLWRRGPYAVRSDSRNFFAIEEAEMIVMNWQDAIWVGSYSQAVFQFLKPEYHNCLLSS